MSLARKMLKSAVRGAYTRLMDRVGGKLVAGIADTSSDAPSAYYVPKRDVYAQMVEDEQRAAGGTTETG